MTTSPKKRRSTLWFLLSVMFVAAAFLMVAPWLRATIGQRMLSWVGAAFVIFVIGYSLTFAIRRQRGLDEVQRASAQFSAHWGMVAGLMAFGLLLSLPPFHDLTVALVRDWAGAPDASGKVVILAMGFGVCGVAIFQSIGTVVMKMIWWKMRQ